MKKVILSVFLFAAVLFVTATCDSKTTKPDDPLEYPKAPPGENDNPDPDEPIVVDPNDVNLTVKEILAKYYTRKDGSYTFLMGAVPTTDANSPLAPGVTPNNKGYQAVNSEFSYITPGNAFKQSQIHPNNNTFNWDKSDTWLASARQYHQVMRLHSPIGPQCSNWTCEAARTSAELETNMRDFMTQVCRRYNEHTDVVKWMDVVNETIHTDGTWFNKRNTSNPGEWQNPWTDMLGFDNSDPSFPVPNYILWAFQIATVEAPDIKLIYNQHNNLEQVAIDKIKKVVPYLRARGCRVDGIGWQAHIRPGWYTQGNLNRISSFIDWCHANDLEFHITEMNLHAPNEAWKQNEIELQAEIFHAYAKLLVQKRKTGFVALNYWNMKACGLADNGSPVCAPWACDDPATPQLAVARIKEMLLEEAAK